MEADGKDTITPSEEDVGMDCEDVTARATASVTTKSSTTSGTDGRIVSRCLL